MTTKTRRRKKDLFCFVYCIISNTK